MHQLGLFTDERPPTTASDTSKAAAVKQAPKSEKQRQAILAFLRACGEYGATDHEMRIRFACHADEVYGPLANESTQRARRWELCGGKNQNQRPVLIVDSGLRRKVASGNTATVWVIR